MPSGGARARSGPAADPNSARSEKRADGWTELPAKSTKRAPAFPLEGMTASEKSLWAAVWKKPQAEMWRRLGLGWQVAGYVRAYLESTERGAPASLKTAVLRMEDTLGLSTVGLNALRWRIKEDDLAARRTTSGSAPVVERPAPVRRLRDAG